MRNQIILKEETDKFPIWGLETQIDLYDCDAGLIRDVDAVKRYVAELCKLIDMKTFGETVVVDFGDDPRVSGFSMTQLIETSLISGHFANQSNAVFINIFSCKYYNQQKAVDFTKEFFKAKKVEFDVTLRGKGID